MAAAIELTVWAELLRVEDEDGIPMGVFEIRSEHSPYPICHYRLDLTEFMAEADVEP